MRLNCRSRLSLSSSINSQHCTAALHVRIFTENDQMSSYRPISDQSNILIDRLAVTLRLCRDCRCSQPERTAAGRLYEGRTSVHHEVNTGSKKVAVLVASISRRFWTPSPTMYCIYRPSRVTDRRHRPRLSLQSRSF